MIQIEDLRLVEALAQAPSLSAAARALNVTPPALSMRLRKLEATLGLALAADCRRLSLTPEGERFAQEGAALLAQLEALPESFRREDSRLTGTLHAPPLWLRAAPRGPAARALRAAPSRLAPATGPSGNALARPP
ncbi:helix-turn-helix domain-containing protein [Cupriavidus basilensis]